MSAERTLALRDTPAFGVSWALYFSYGPELKVMEAPGYMQMGKVTKQQEYQRKC